MEADSRATGAAQRVNRPAVFLDEREQPSGCLGRRTGDFLHSLQEEPKPRFPFTMGSDPLEVGVILFPVPLQVEAEIEKRRGHDLLLFSAKEQCDQEPPDAAVAVKERMNRLELRMRQRRLHE